MIKVKYIGDRTYYDVNIVRSEHVITMLGNIPFKDKGFRTYSDEGIQLGEFPNFTTLYKQLPNGIKLSDDGSVAPTTTLPIFVNWEDNAPIDCVSVTYRADDVEGDIEVYKSNNWEAEVEAETIEVLSAETVLGYTSEILGDNIFYRKNSLIPNLEQRIEDLEIAVCELADMLSAEE